MIEFNGSDGYKEVQDAAAIFVENEEYMTEKVNVWNDDRLEELEKLWSEGLSISQIGEALGVSRNSIAGKAHRMGLPKRPSPISRRKVDKPKIVVPDMPKELPLRFLNCVGLNGLVTNVAGQQVTLRKLALFFVVRP